MAIVELAGIVKYYGRHRAVENVTIDIRDGEFVSLLGGSGCGKTTILRLIAGFETPTAGSIRINGADVAGVPPNRRGVGMVFQNFALFPNMTAAQNIGFGLKVRGRPRQERQAQVMELLHLIHMEEYAARYPHQLSGGQQQRVALARALAPHPRVLLLDEPLSALDAQIRVRLRAEIRAIQRQLGIATLYVTHDQEEALSLSDRVVVMRDGCIEQEGTPFQIYHRPASTFVASFIGTLNVLPGTVRDASAGTLLVEGHEIRTAGPLAAQSGEGVSVAVRPEAIHVLNGASPANQFSGRLAGVLFLGSIVRLVLEVGSMELLVDTFNDPHLVLPTIGSMLRIGFSEEAATILGRGQVVMTNAANREPPRAVRS
jgi:putative spermidine/putrescine transport system ATP-binding protein